MHKYPYYWHMADLNQVEKNGRRVFSFFSCGGGSSLGYKLAGYDVIGNNEIDPKMNAMYVKNHHPKYTYEMDIRQFVQMDDAEIPAELFDLDILDGSPPCSVFSSAGAREADWGKPRKFAEGQAEQTLDDLFFWYIWAVEKLKPKVFLAENVKGLLTGKAKGYVNEIIKGFDAAGYTVQVFLLNAASMGVPQRRERVFFIGHRKEIDWPKLRLAFNEKPILYGELAEEDYIPFGPASERGDLWKMRKAKDSRISDIKLREQGKLSGFNVYFVHRNQVANTQVASQRLIRFDKPGYVSDRDVCCMQTFPQDYDFCGNDANYVCGMSVPPVMMANIADAISKQWFDGGE